MRPCDRTVAQNLSKIAQDWVFNAQNAQFIEKKNPLFGSFFIYIFKSVGPFCFCKTFGQKLGARKQNAFRKSGYL